MKFQFEIDLEAIEGNPHHTAHLLGQIAQTLAAGAWGDDMRDDEGSGPRAAEIMVEGGAVMARVRVVDEGFDPSQQIARPAAMAPLNDPLNTTPVPKATLQ